MKRNIVSIGTVIMILFLFNITHATVWYVHPDSTQNCIQDCLVACTTGDTVLVGPGTYFENINWPDVQSIKLISEFGRDTTIINGGDTGRVITLSVAVDSSTVIRGFTICNGYISVGNGAGVLCENSAEPLIEVNQISANWNSDPYGCGGGLGCENSSPLVRDNLFFMNHGAWGAAVGLLFSNAKIYSNDIIGNYADTVGGGICCYHSERPDIEYNKIIGNTSSYGAGIYCITSSPSVTRNIIAYDTAFVGGGIGITWSSAPNVFYNTIEFNKAQYNGGGVFCSMSNPFLLGNQITNNYAGLSGGGIRSVANSWPQVESCAIYNNTLYGISCRYDAGITIHYSNIAGNKYGLISENSDTLVDASFNWWGDSTGPYHDSLNPGGLGDTVSDYVDFEPWLWEPAIGLFEQNRPLVKHTPVQTTIVRGVINLQSTIKHSKSEIVLLDITGRKVADLKTGTNNIRHLAPGVYFIRSINNYQVTKIIVTR